MVIVERVRNIARTWLQEISKSSGTIRKYLAWCLIVFGIALVLFVLYASRGMLALAANNDFLSNFLNILFQVLPLIIVSLLGATMLVERFVVYALVPIVVLPMLLPRLLPYIYPPASASEFENNPLLGVLWNGVSNHPVYALLLAVLSGVIGIFVVRLRRLEGINNSWNIVERFIEEWSKGLVFMLGVLLLVSAVFWIFYPYHTVNPCVGRFVGLAGGCGLSPNWHIQHLNDTITTVLKILLNLSIGGALIVSVLFQFRNWQRGLIFILAGLLSLLLGIAADFVMRDACPSSCSSQTDSLPSASSFPDLDTYIAQADEIVIGKVFNVAPVQVCSIKSDGTEYKYEISKAAVRLQRQLLGEPSEEKQVFFTSAVYLNESHDAKKVYRYSGLPISMKPGERVLLFLWKTSRQRDNVIFGCSKKYEYPFGSIVTDEMTHSSVIENSKGNGFLVYCSFGEPFGGGMGAKFTLTEQTENEKFLINPELSSEKKDGKLIVRGTNSFFCNGTYSDKPGSQFERLKKIQECLDRKTAAPVALTVILSKLAQKGLLEGKPGTLMTK